MSLIVLEGLDGSGKGTQTKLLAESLEGRGVPLRHVTFPDYDSPSSALVRMYLDGEFGSEPEDVNAYAASAFYAVDRFASFKRDWKTDYDRGDADPLRPVRHLQPGIPDGGKHLGTSGSSTWLGWRTWNMKSWGSPGRTWCSTWICPLRFPAAAASALPGGQREKRHPRKPFGVPPRLPGVCPVRRECALLEGHPLRPGREAPPGGGDPPSSVGGSGALAALKKRLACSIGRVGPIAWPVVGFRAHAATSFWKGTIVMVVVFLADGFEEVEALALWT